MAMSEMYARAVLEAWQKAFGTTQLTHAVARLEAAESKRDRLERENESLRDRLEEAWQVISKAHDFLETLDTCGRRYRAEHHPDPEDDDGTR